jgi:HAD superfamily hydrolase (TIGR01549 family)
VATDAILFDLDGTVWKSFPWYGRMLQRDGATAAEVVEQLRAGRSIIRIHTKCGISASRFRRLCSSTVRDLELYPEVRTTLKELRRRGTQLGVATSLPGWLVEMLLNEHGLTGFFGSVIHAGNCRSYKPNPAPILAALRGLDVGPSPDAFYVGDREVDSRAAASAGVSFAWAAYGYGDERPTDTAKVIRSFKEVLAL